MEAPPRSACPVRVGSAWSCGAIQSHLVTAEEANTAHAPPFMRAAVWRSTSDAAGDPTDFSRCSCAGAECAPATQAAARARVQAAGAARHPRARAGRAARAGAARRTRTACTPPQRAAALSRKRAVKCWPGARAGARGEPCRALCSCAEVDLRLSAKRDSASLLEMVNYSGVCHNKAGACVACLFGWALSL